MVYIQIAHIFALAALSGPLLVAAAPADASTPCTIDSAQISAAAANALSRTHLTSISTDPVTAQGLNNFNSTLQPIFDTITLLTATTATPDIANQLEASTTNAQTALNAINPTSDGVKAQIQAIGSDLTTIANAAVANC